MHIIIDADATPKNVVAICRQIAEEFFIPIITVASYNHLIQWENHIVVDGESQEADLRIIHIVRPRDIVITQDWGLAAIVLSKGAAAMSPAGRVFRAETIDFLLEEREIKAKYRRSGGKTKGPRKRTAKDDQCFKKNLINLLKSVIIT